MGQGGERDTQKETACSKLLKNEKLVETELLHF